MRRVQAAARAVDGNVQREPGSARRGVWCPKQVGGECECPCVPPPFPFPSIPMAHERDGE